ncbi:MAG: MATE family efflux transporter [Phycisphaerae bacterium]|nr:MATE family efflux transporter [Phycisphaerae bacterium]
MTTGTAVADADSLSVPTAVEARSTLVTGSVRRKLFVLAMPVLAEQLLNTAVGTFDIFLAGRLSAAATSAVGLAAYVAWLVSMLAAMIGIGTTALVSRHEGAGDRHEANHVANQSLTLAVALAVLIAALIYGIAPAIATYCRMTGESFTITVDYLRIGALGLACTTVTLVACAALRGIGNMRTPMFIFALINLLNMSVSWALVYGPGPIPSLGVRGIVTGTVVAHAVGLALTLVLLARGRVGLRLVPRETVPTWERTRRILHVGVPAGADGAIMWSGHFCYLAILSRLADPPLGTAYFAAHMIAVRTESLVYLPAVAWAAATATMIGQALGAGNPIRAKQVGHEGVRQCGILAVIVSAVLFIGANTVYAVMSSDPLVREAGTAPFRVLFVLTPALVVSIVYVGGLRGAGDTRTPMLITIVGITLRLAVGYLGGIVLQMGLLGAWMGMFTDMIWRAIASSVRYFRGKWLQTRV